MKRPRAFPPFVSAAPFYSTVLLAFAFAANASYPIVNFDGDMWFHLNGGRYILQNRALPTSAFFSFLTPPRPWLDYSWLFDASIYAWQRIAGFPGLILLRAGLFLATLTAVRAFLLRDGPGGRSLARHALFLAYVFFLWPRFLEIRPYICSDLMLVLGLFILDRRPDRMFFLPLIALAWGNLHGIYFPVMIAVCGIYALELFLNQRDLKTPGGQRRLVFIAAAMIAFFLTPLGTGLLDLPFISLDYVRHSIGELHSFDWRQLLSYDFEIKAFAPSTRSLFLAYGFKPIFYAALLSFSTAAAGKKLRVSHALLLGAGLALLTRGQRFDCECALLLLPLLGGARLFDGDDIGADFSKPLRTAVSAALLGAPFFLLTGARPHYPMSAVNLPAGTAAFLNRIGSGGRVLSDPLRSSYFEWALAPNYRIASDMHVPLPFGDDDNYLTRTVFADPKLMGAFISRYYPDFIVTPPQNRILSAFPGYRPIFFDDNSMLYVESARHPDVFREYALTVDPLSLPWPKDVPVEAGSECGLPAYLRRMLEIAPHVLTTTAYAAEICESHHDFQRELELGKSIVRDYPDFAVGYRLEGSALRLLGKDSDSLRVLRRGLRLADEREAKKLNWQIAQVYMARRDYVRAREYALDADDLYPPVSWHNVQ